MPQINLRRVKNFLRRAKSSLQNGVVDSAWYLGRYPDVSAEGMRARRHYELFGKLEGRFPNAEAEIKGQSSLISPPSTLDQVHALGEEKTDIGQFDAAWYLKRYPDIGSSGMDPLQHYIRYGQFEHRTPCPEKESRAAWRSRFDENWYRARNPDLGQYADDPLQHFLFIGILEDRAPNASEENKKNWKGTFNAAWYLNRNLDVRDAGIDPFEHYITHGILERRRCNPAQIIESRPVIDADIECLKSNPLGSEVVLFITHSPDGTLKAHVKHHLKSFKREGISTILIVASNSKITRLPREVIGIPDVVYVRANEGFDFSAWAHIIKLNPAIVSGKILYFANDSVFGPTSEVNFAKLIADIRSSDADLIGLTENTERGWHLQSYFLAFKRRLLSSSAFKEFIDEIVSFTDKNDVVNEYETQLSRSFTDRGFRCEALFPSANLPNTTLNRWKELLHAGFPYLKVSTLSGSVKGIDITDWREILTSQGYDVRLADHTLADLAGRTSVPAITLKEKKFNFRQESLVELHNFFAEENYLELPSHPEPIVSIVIVVYNEAELTYRCLRSLVETVDVAAEYIIIDNASSDDTQCLLGRVKNAKILRNVEDLHFLRAANQGAARARGKALLFLNNDIRLEKGAVRYGLETLESSDDIGFVGGKLILPDGTLQEAGSIIWSDGACGGFGRGQMPDSPEFNYLRDVDYCSGAYMIMRRDVFEKLNRFDVAYAPAYYEETDLCMRIRAAGFRVIFDPRIVVNHYEFASAAYEGEASALMQRNFNLFFSRHASALQRLHLPQSAPLHLSKDTNRARLKVLMIEDLLPFVSHGAGFPRSNAILHAFVKAGYFVTYYSVNEADATIKELRDNFPLQVEFILGINRPSLLDLIEQRAGYYNGIFICRPGNMNVVRDHFSQRPEIYRGAVLIYDAEAVCAPRDIMQRELSGEKFGHEERQTIIDNEIGLSDVADLVLVVNEQDGRHFELAGRPNVRVLGHALNTTPTQKAFSERNDFLFVGRLRGDQSPNVDALIWFIDEIMPRIDQRIGTDWRLIVAGSVASERLDALKNKRIVLLGRIEKLDNYYSQAKVFIAPTRYAAGIPLKVYEAAAYGVPSVVTPILADQLGWGDDKAVLVGVDAEHFSEQCARLYTDAVLWDSVRESGLAQIRENNSLEAFELALSSSLRSVRLSGNGLARASVTPEKAGNY